VFKTIEVGVWYRIRWEGKSIFGRVLEHHGNSYMFRYADEKGKVRTGKVSRSDIVGRLGDHLIPELESTITPAKRRRATESKAKTRNAKTIQEPAKKMPRLRKVSTVRKKGQPSKGQRLLFPK
jgi:hypothetical protein